MKKVKENNLKTFKEDDTTLTEFILQFHYDTEQEKENHRKEMVKKGYEDSGQVRENVNKSVLNPKYVWFGSYYKYEVE